MSRALFFLSLFAFACTNLEDAKPSNRKSSIRFYGSPRDYLAKSIELDSDGGFIIGADIPASGTLPPAVVLIKTDRDGNMIWEKIFDNGSVSSVKVLSDGYLITGDGIELNPGSNQISELENTQMRLIKTDNNGDSPVFFLMDSTITVDQGIDSVILHVDFHGNASTIDNNGKEVVTLGSYKTPSGTERIITAGFNPNNLKPVWSKTLQLENYNYQNTNTLNQISGQLIWVSTRTPLDASSSAHLGIATVTPNFASPSNYSLFGEKNEERAHIAGDMQPSATGFGIIGTYQEKDKSSANLFFLKIDAAGNVMSGSQRYFDGEGANGVLLLDDRNTSVSQDSGNAITSTYDGGFILAGSMNTTPTKGNGGADILLIKIDAFGTPVWDKVLGGSGDEIVSGIRELADGSIVVCGTVTINNSSTVFVMKTDKNGNLKD